MTIAALACLSSSAMASTAYVASEDPEVVLVFEAGAGVENDVTIDVLAADGVVELSDATPITPGTGCTTASSDSTQVHCQIAGLDRVHVLLGDRDDWVSSVDTTPTLPVRVDGGPGDDWLSGGAGPQQMVGNEGDDYLDASAGGPGDSDSYYGGPGHDIVSYSGRSSGVRIWLDGYSDDGDLGGENDNVASDVEELWGGLGADTLSGGPGGSVLVGGPGGDVLQGMGWDDVLDGGPGPDAINGGEGSDVVSYVDRSAPVHVDLDGASGDDGEPGEGDSVGADVEGILGGLGDDTLFGNAGAGFLYGGEGHDRLVDSGGEDDLDGGPGLDHLESRDGAVDEDTCGDGYDEVVGDEIDLIDPDCEVRDIPSPAQRSPPLVGTSPGPTSPLPRPPFNSGRRPPPAPDHIAPTTIVSYVWDRSTRATLKKGLSVIVLTSEACSIRVRLTASPSTARRMHLPARTVLARADSGRLYAPRRELKLRLTTLGRRHLPKLRKGQLKLAVTVTDGVGNVTRILRYPRWPD
jgi:serralysin